MENFDFLGKWRTQEILGKIETDPRKKRRAKNKPAPKKIPVDASGYLSKSETFDGFEGLKQALYKRRHQLALSIYEGLLSYGIGRDVEFIDEDEVKASLKNLEKSNYRVGDLITAVVSSTTFRTK